MVLRMLASVRDLLGYDLTTIVVDDGPQEQDAAVAELFNEFPAVQYIIGDRELGTSRGRNLAVKHVTTRYFIVIDDDFLFNQYTTVKDVVRILDITDASLVGGRVVGDWSGNLYMRKINNKRVIFHHSRSCYNSPIAGVPGCFKCDITDVFFVARTDHYKEVGGWSEAIKTAEHEDLFMRLKSAGKKVVLCKEFSIDHVRHSDGTDGQGNALFDPKAYLALRRGRSMRYAYILTNHWNVQSIVKSKSWIE